MGREESKKVRDVVIRQKKSFKIRIKEKVINIILIIKEAREREQGRRRSRKFAARKLNGTRGQPPPVRPTLYVVVELGGHHHRHHFGVSVKKEQQQQQQQEPETLLT